MLSKNERISNFQNMILIIHTIIGVGVLSAPSTLAEKVNTGGWVVIIVAAVFVCIVVTIFTKLMQMYPGKTIVEIEREVVGNALTSILVAAALLYLIGTSAFIVRIFAEVIKMFLLLKTPIEIIILTFLLTTAYVCRAGIEPLARICILVTPFILIPLAVITLAVMQDLDFTNLLPLFRFSTKDVIGALPSAFFSFGGYDLILLYMAFVEKPKESLKYNVLAIIIIAVIYIFLFVLSITSFGAKGLTNQIWPLLLLMKIVEFPGSFIENVDGIVMAIWVLITFTTLGPTLYVNSLLLERAFKLKEYNFFVLALIPIIFIISLIPDNVIQVYKVMETFSNYMGTFAAIVAPIVVYIIALFKNRGGAKKNEKDA